MNSWNTYDPPYEPPCDPLDPPTTNSGGVVTPPTPGLTTMGSTEFCGYSVNGESTPG